MKRLWLLVALAGCNGGAPAGGGASGSASAAPTASAPTITYLPIDATWKNKPLKIASALAFSRGGSALNVTFSTHPIACADLRRGVQRVPGEITFALTFAPVLERDGKETWGVSRARFGQVTRQGMLAPVTLSTFKPTETVKTQIEAKLSFPPNELSLTGAFDVTGCGLMPVSTDAKVIRQEGLKASLAGEAVAMNGATFITKGEQRHLRLSSEPHSCKSTAGSDVTVTVILPKEGDEPIGVRVDGFRLPRALGAKLEPGALTATPGDGAAEGEVRYAVKGDVAVGGYPLHLDGDVTAQICDK